MTTATLHPSQLIPVETCPACGSRGGRRVEEAFARNKYEELLRELGAPVDAVRLIRCESCGSLYRNPWLSVPAMTPIYEGRYATHPDGMSKFTTPDHVFEQSYIRGGASRFNAFLHRRVKPFHRYGEIGCPLWGLFPYYERVRYRWLGVLELPVDAQLAGILIGHLGRSRLPVIRLLRTLTGMQRVPAPQHLYWLTHTSPTFWGRKCEYNGLPCDHLVQPRELLRVPAGEEIPGGPLDALSMIDFLDHHADPVSVLAPLARQTRFLFIWTHGSHTRMWSVQHVINYTGTGLARLARRSGFELVCHYPDDDERDDFGVLLKSTQL